MPKNNTPITVVAAYLTVVSFGAFATFLIMNKHGISGGLLMFACIIILIVLIASPDPEKTK